MSLRTALRASLLFALSFAACGDDDGDLDAGPLDAGRDGGVMDADLVDAEADADLDDADVDDAEADADIELDADLVDADLDADVDACVPVGDDDDCDGVDDDCDGSIDEAFVASETTCGVGACASTGTSTCEGGAVIDSCESGTPLSLNDATCDGIDDDCDGSDDEDYAVATTTCDCGGTGTLSCIAGEPVDSCAPGEPAANDPTCDGVDDDCDGSVDEDFTTSETSCGVGACAGTGVVSCELGVASNSCTVGTPAPADANCDGVDDDCDGVADEGYVSISTACGTGACASAGSTSCVSGSVVDSCEAGAPAANDATCNGIDDDCNGAVDEDFASAATSCGVGACAASGATSCVSGAVVDSCEAGAPAAIDASCNGIDDDCNGAVDEDFVSSPTSCGVGGCAASGATSCVSGTVLDSCTAGTPAVNDATCDGVDDDCNGAIDEDFASTSTSCGVGVCAASGATSCVSGAVVDSCEAGTPAANDASCNGLDDDCNGAVDEDFVSSATSCGVGGCAASGATSCVSGSVVDSCEAGTPSGTDDDCDGLDDDCDGSADESFASTATACGAGVCTSTGTRTCVAGSLVDSCSEGPTTGADDDCDNLDDDCDGSADESFMPTAIACGIGACGATGSRVCTSGAIVDVCTPGLPASGDATCNGIDDDCDAIADEDYGAMSTACGVGACAAVGSTSCTGGVEADTCTPGTPAMNDATCDGVDDDCDGSVDEDCVFTIGFCRVQFPTSATLAAGADTTVYGRLYVAGLTDRSVQNDPNGRVIGQVGYGADGSVPDATWTWSTAIPNPGWDGNAAGSPNDDEYQATLVAPALGGAYDYAYRFSGDGGSTWTNCDADAAGNTNGYAPADAGQLTVTGGAVAPTITGLDYTVLAHGGRVTITGTELDTVTDVSIGGTMQMLESASATSVTVVVADATAIGAQTLTLTTPGGSATSAVTVIRLVINELDADTEGSTDVLEFVEIATGVPGVSLTGYSLVLWNGNGNTSYRAIELNAVTDANGLLLLGNTGVGPTISFPNGTLQNGEDAVAIHQRAATTFPTGTALTAAGVLDALVYETADPDAPALLDTLLAPAPSMTRVQVDESQGGSPTTHSIARCTPARRDGRAFFVLTPPTPGLPNSGCP